MIFLGRPHPSAELSSGVPRLLRSVPVWGAVSCRMESGSSRKDRGLLSSPLKAALSPLSSVLFWCLLQEEHLFLGFLQDSDNVSSVRAGVCGGVMVLNMAALSVYLRHHCAQRRYTEAEALQCWT